MSIKNGIVDSKA